MFAVLQPVPLPATCLPLADTPHFPVLVFHSIWVLISFCSNYGFEINICLHFPTALLHILYLLLSNSFSSLGYLSSSLPYGLFHDRCASFKLFSLTFKPAVYTLLCDAGTESQNHIETVPASFLFGSSYRECRGPRKVQREKRLAPLLLFLFLWGSHQLCFFTLAAMVLH